MHLVFSIGTIFFLKVSSSRSLFSLADWETNMIEFVSIDLPYAPNIGLLYTGWGVGIDALGSPIWAQVITPPISTISGFTPKKAVFHKTKSALFPISILPIWVDIPCAIAGLIVYFATYLFIRRLSFSPFSSDNLPRCFFILSAVCHVRIITSPTRPIAWLSEAIIDIAPTSWSISSAAIVSFLILLSAKATSSGIDLSRWWHTINISKCSSIVLMVYGLVGLVEEGITFSSPASLIISGAWPPPAPSVWKACIVRPPIALIVFSTNPLSLSVSVWIITCTSNSSATFKQQSIAPGVVPQSSWSFREEARAVTCSLRASGRLAFPFPAKDKFIGKASADCSIFPMFQGPGVHVVASVPCAGPVPPPNMVVSPEWSASSICWGQIKWIWASIPPAVKIFPSPAMTSVAGPTIIFTPLWISGYPAFPIEWILPSFTPISALYIPK